MKHLFSPPALAALVVLGCGSLRAEPFYATDGASLATFDSTSLSVVTTVAVTGLQPAETLTGIDLRPANGVLYGVGSTSRLYTINPATGVATQVGTAGAFTLNGTYFGTDFNPVPDRLRQVSDTEQNLRLNPNDGTLSATDSNLNPAGNIVGVAYTNNYPGATKTTLYGIDSVSGNLVLIGSINGTPVSPNTGNITVVGSLGLGATLDQNIGFDVSGLTGIAYATITVGGQSRLYTVNLDTGLATSLGAIGTGLTAYRGVTAATVGTPPSVRVNQPPTINIFGKKNPRTSHFFYRVRGTATDDSAVARVEYSLSKNKHNGPFIAAQGTYQWSAKVPLRKLLTHVTVRAVDDEGAVSASQTINVHRNNKPR
ncbi:MAG: DUF4394 domain-containing protein [Chthoniobacterales bacterium]